MRFINILILLLSQALFLTAQESIVENVRVSQEANRIFIVYDLKINSVISLVVLENGTEIFEFKVNGDVGYTQAGNSKKIILIPDNETMVCQGCIFKVSAYLNRGSVIIGQQVWQDRNLNVSKFMNGDDIPEAKTAYEWKMAGERKRPAWCYYNNDSNNGETYGKLYNWYAVQDPRGLAPAGWHIPSDDEWQILINNLGGDGVAGAKMRLSMGLNKGDNGSNSSGFSGLPGGYCYSDGTFVRIGKYAYWWSSSVHHNFGAWFRYMFYDVTYVDKNNLGKESGLSIRCVKD